MALKRPLWPLKLPSISPTKPAQSCTWYTPICCLTLLPFMRATKRALMQELTYKTKAKSSHIGQGRLDEQVRKIEAAGGSVAQAHFRIGRQIGRASCRERV